MSKKSKRNVRLGLIVIKNVLKFLYTISAIALLLWIGFSIIEVWIQNWNMSSESPNVYSSFNVFEVLFKV